MWNKRGVNQIDWAISIAVFILYLSWFFILIRPYYLPVEDMPLMNSLEEQLMDDLLWKVNKTPLIVFSDIDASYEPVAVNFSIGISKSNFAFSDNMYFTIFEDEIYFLADLKKGTNLFWIVSSDNTYEEPNIHTDLYATNYSASVTGMRATYYDSMLRKVYYKDKLAIDDFKIMRYNIPVEVNVSYFNSSKIISVHSADTDAGFNHSSSVFGYNSRLYSRIILDPFIEQRRINLNMKIKGYPKYYADNLNFGEIKYPKQCAEFDKQWIFFYNDDDVMYFVLQDESEIKLCYSGEDEIELNISIQVEKETEYRLYFEPFANKTIGFNFTDIMSKLHFGNYESYFGMPEEFEGISEEKMELIANMSYQELKSIWAFPAGRDFRITLFSET